MRRQWPKLIAMLKAHDLILGSNIGQRRDQLASILWNPTLPVGIQASVYRDSHTVPNIVSTARQQGLRTFRPIDQISQQAYRQS